MGYFSIWLKWGISPNRSGHSQPLSSSSYKGAKVLHCDLSKGKPMIYQSDANHVRGVVDDWRREWPMSTTANHCTSTPPFVSIDILDVTCLQHLYRHDLESFFCIFVCCAC